MFYLFSWTFGAIFVARTAFKCPGRAAIQCRGAMKEKVGRWDALCGRNDASFQLFSPTGALLNVKSCVVASTKAALSNRR